MLNKIWDCAIYCRLSKEDLNKGYSESIKMQENELKRYVFENNWNLVDVYIDDGVSGTTFERNDFKRMMEDVERGLVNCIVTKDLSRLGRDYIEMGKYLEKIFPEYGVRYIALNDGIDTLNGEDDSIPFRNVVNDMYAKDISKKIRFNLRSKMKDGLFIGAFAPYGYKKDPNNKNRLVPANDITTEAIKRIFSLYMEGFGKQKIAKILTDEGYPTPAESKENYKNGNQKIKMWNSNAVHRILTNEVYIGTIVQHKRKRISYKVKKMKDVPEEEWIKKPNMHEAIISEDVFWHVQDIIKNRSKLKFRPGHVVHLFSGKARCGDCGSYMGYFYDKDRKEPCWKLICGAFRKYGSKACTMHSISEEKLKQVILNDLKSISGKYVDKTQLLKLAEDSVEENYTEQKIFYEEYKRKLSDLQNTFKQMYFDKIKGLLTDEQFKMLSEGLQKEASIYSEKLKEIENEINAENRKIHLLQQAVEKIKCIVEMNDLTRQMVESLIDEIEIFNDHKIKIHYRFSNPENYIS
ncbi:MULTISPECIES: recombinase family protein [Thermoanaerobacterium]|uniref:Recombinase n=2 Tax=Thermoanaerobacterium TaxID=28895 RepID=W9E950_9THEO|nr:MULTISPECIES: recombinase family protein [Thermoanaerobacterium]AFK86553.1 Recombinase [Thermoanaerobacterium saccharolyticum JW/SL-YS485]ETO38433.1 recombinase [Thermoanaerobacterium aotearoense SCUT27]